ncbi:MAG: hypothetical protein IPK27_14920 [Rhodanobacteraceae bacterium]|nr:hypothetical protein [Rhodanobacteraceae bacterium]
MSLDQLLSGAQARIESAADLAALDALRVELLGKSGSVTALLKTLGSLSPEERKTRGAEVNRVRAMRSAALNQRKSTLDRVALAPSWSASASASTCRVARSGWAACIDHPRADPHRQHLRAPGLYRGRRPGDRATGTTSRH